MADAAVDGESWYDWMQEKWVDLTRRPSEKGESYDRCVIQVQEAGHDEKTAHAICTESVKCGLKSGQRKSLLEATKAATETGEDGDVATNFCQAIELLDLDAEATKQTVPENAVNIDSRSEAPEDAEVIEGPRGGLYMIPPGNEDDSSDDELPSVTELTLGQEVEIRLPDGEVVPGLVGHVIDAEGEEPTAFVQGPDGSPLEVRDDSEGEAELVNVGGDDAESEVTDIRDEFNSEAAPDHLDIGQAEEISTLPARNIQGGHDESAMRVASMPNGSSLFARLGEETGTDVQKTAEIGNFYNALTDNAADAYYDEDSNVTVTEGLDGELAGDVTADDIDTDSFYEAMGASLLAGNYDIHTSNLMVSEDGEVHSFDYDHGGEQLFGEGDDESLDPDTMREMFFESVRTNAKKIEFGTLPLEVVREGVMEAAERILADVDDPGTLVDGIKTEGLADTLQANLEGVLEGTDE